MKKKTVAKNKTIASKGVPLNPSGAMRVLQLAAAHVDGDDDAAACREFADFLDSLGLEMRSPFGNTAREFVETTLDILIEAAKALRAAEGSDHEGR